MASGIMSGCKSNIHEFVAAVIYLVLIKTTSRFLTSENTEGNQFSANKGHIPDTKPIFVA